jgi:hypothetical protein
MTGPFTNNKIRPNHELATVQDGRLAHLGRLTHHRRLAFWRHPGAE